METRVRSTTARVLGATASLTVICLLASTLASASGERFQLLRFGGHYVKWGERTLGSGATVTYAFANTTMRFDDAVNCRTLTPVDQLAARSRITTDAFRAETAAAFRVWEQAADLTFVAVDDPEQADIVIGAQGRPAGHAFADVAYRPETVGDGVKLIKRSLVCLNPQRRWKIGFDGDVAVYDLRFTLVHEIGHAIGLDHPSPSGQVMSFRYTEDFSELQPGDRRGVAVLYGSGADNGVPPDTVLAHRDAALRAVREPAERSGLSIGP
jgi:hypothetical protein